MKSQSFSANFRAPRIDGKAAADNNIREQLKLNNLHFSKKHCKNHNNML